MSRNSQSKYLEGILDADGESVPQEAPRPVSSPLLSRSNSLARIASGEVRQVTQLRLDPSRCTIWPGNGRDYHALTVERCQELIDSIKAEGGQKVPALVRRVKDDPDHDYEVIYGTRRHWVISYLRANNYPEMTFLAEVREIDDEAAFRLADIENRAREDITELERARNYAMALPLHYGGKQARMAERLNLSAGWLSKMLSFASIPPRIFEAFSQPGELSLKQGYRLFQAIANPESEKRALAEAHAIIKKRSEMEGSEGECISTAEVLSRLLKASAGLEDAPSEPHRYFYEGKAVVTVLDDNRNGVRIQVHNGTGADIDAIVESVRQALLASRVNGARV
jgi:ParB family transcriptional regulator, chromosome partitioning protein